MHAGMLSDVRAAPARTHGTGCAPDSTLRPPPVCAATGAPDAAQESYAAADLESRALAMYAPAMAGGAPRADTPAEADAQVSPSVQALSGLPDAPAVCVALPAPEAPRKERVSACVYRDARLVGAEGAATEGGEGTPRADEQAGTQKRLEEERGSLAMSGGG